MEEKEPAVVSHVKYMSKKKRIYVRKKKGRTGSRTQVARIRISCATVTPPNQLDVSWGELSTHDCTLGAA